MTLHKIIVVFFIVMVSGALGAQQPANIEHQGVLVEYRRQTQHIAFHPSGEWIAFSDENRVRRITIADGASEPEIIMRHDESPATVTFQGDDLYYFNLEGLFRYDGVNVEQTIETDAISALAASEEALAIGFIDGRVMLDDVELALSDVSITALTFANEQLFVGTSAGTVFVIEADTVIDEWEAHNGSIRAIAVHPSGLVATTTTRARQVTLWHDEPLTWSAQVNSLVFLDDTLLGGGSTLYVWDIATGAEQHQTYHSHPSIDAANLVLAPNGSYLVGGSRWLSVWSANAFTPSLAQYSHEPIIEGQILYGRNGCNGCHFEYDSGAPTLYGLGEASEGRVAGLSPADYIYQGIVDPDAYIPERYPRGIHPEYYGDRLSHKQVLMLVEYIMSLETR